MPNASSKLPRLSSVERPATSIEFGLKASLECGVEEEGGMEDVSVGGEYSCLCTCDQNQNPDYVHDGTERPSISKAFVQVIDLNPRPCRQRLLLKKDIQMNKSFSKLVVPCI